GVRRAARGRRAAMRAAAPGSSGRACARLLTETEPADDALVAFKVLALEVVEQASPLADHLHQAESRVVVLRVAAEVAGEVLDPLGEAGDLDFRGAGVGVVGSVILDQLVLMGGRQRHVSSSSGAVVRRERPRWLNSGDTLRSVAGYHSRSPPGKTRSS